MFFDIPDQYFSIISDYAKIIIPSLITYLITKYTLIRPRQYEIRLKQFNLVYLPLYLLSKQLISDNHKWDNLLLFIRKADKIIYKNYPFVYPKTEKLFIKVKNGIQNNDANNFDVVNLIYQIESDYEKLKRELGYPTESIIDFFKRLNKMDKLMYFLIILLLSSGLFFVVLSFFYLFRIDILNTLFSLLSATVFLTLAYIIHYRPY